MPTSVRKEGDFFIADFFQNSGGLNVTDSPFTISDDQATAGFNYDYIQTGAIRKRFGSTAVNSVANAQLKTIGFAVYETASGGTKSAVRAAGTALQSVDLTAATFTNLSDDTAAANISFLTTSQVVTSTQFNSPASNIRWLAGGGMSAIYGAYSTTKVTKNGVALPTGSIGGSAAGTGGTFVSTGTYFYSVALHKASTSVLSNAALDISVSVSATTQQVTLTLGTMTAVDATLYDKIYIYRSPVSGVTGFTTGDLIAQVTAGTASYVDSGTYISTAVNVPRVGNIILDNSPLPTPVKAYQNVVTFKRRLVTADASTVYISDINKSESWPIGNTFTIPSAGAITALAVISFITPTTSSIDELLVIFKQNEMWIIQGTSPSDFVLKFLDNIGCANQNLIVNVSGYIAWVDYRGIYIWGGTGKPIYCSRPIEALFNSDGDLDKSQLVSGWGTFFRKNNFIMWSLSNKALPTQTFQVRLDLRLTLPKVLSNLVSTIVDGVFTFDSTPFALYGGSAFIPNASVEEYLFAGDDSGFIYQLYQGTNDNNSGINFSYKTKFLEMGTLNKTKRFHSVIVWVADLGVWPLSLSYWTNYRSSTGLASIQKRNISDNTQSNGSALWDFASWDQFYWDDYTSNIRPVVFHLQNNNNNNEGDCLQLQFSQAIADQPVTIYGYSIVYTELAMRKGYNSLI